MRARAAFLAVLFALVAGCSDDEAPVRRGPSGGPGAQAQSGLTDRWAFVDAIASLKSGDPARRLLGVDWIGRHLSAHPNLGRETLLAATADESPDVAARARQWLRKLEGR